MPLHYKYIKNERQWRATIGLISAKFYSLVGLFKASYEEPYGMSLEQGAARPNKQRRHSAIAFMTPADYEYFLLNNQMAA